MHTELRFQTQVVETTVDNDTIIKISQDDRYRFTITVASPGAKVAAVRLAGISELQLKNMIQEAIRLL